MQSDIQLVLLFVFATVDSSYVATLPNMSSYGEVDLELDHLTNQKVTIFKPERRNPEIGFMELKPIIRKAYNWGRSEYHGTEGINYYIEDDGRTPYILCEYHWEGNDDDTLNHKVEPDGNTTRCYMDHRLEGHKFGCSAAFEQTRNADNTTSLRMRRKGCDVQQIAHADYYCKQDECIEHARNTEEGSFDLVFCCCNSNKCNGQLSSKPPIKRLDEDDGDDVLPFIPESPPKVQQVQVVNWTMWIILGSLMVVIIVVVVAVAFFLQCCKEKRSHETQADAEQGTPLMKKNKTHPFTPEQLANHNEKFIFTDFELLSAGRISNVFFAKLHRVEDSSSTKVAVKIFAKCHLKSFKHELSIYNLPKMKECSSDSILHYLGWDHIDQREFRIVLDYYPKGTLHRCLKATVPTPREALGIMRSALEGLSYLHEESIEDGVVRRAIAHRDIKSRNILLRIRSNGSVEAVIADFGFALELEMGNLKKKTHEQVGTARYMAPELLVGTQQISPSAFKAIDVYAMAMVLWEILSRTEANCTEDVPEYLAPFEEELPGFPTIRQMANAVVIQNLQLKFRESILNHPNLTKVAETCQEMWHFESEGRVSASFAVERIKNIMDDSEGYASGTDSNDSNCSNQTEPLTPAESSVINKSIDQATESSEENITSMTSIDEKSEQDPLMDQSSAELH